MPSFLQRVSIQLSAERFRPKYFPGISQATITFDQTEKCFVNLINIYINNKKTLLYSCFSFQILVKSQK